jgi:hypothetical protein
MLESEVGMQVLRHDLWSPKTFRAKRRFIAAHAECFLDLGMSSNAISTSTADSTAFLKCMTDRSKGVIYASRFLRTVRNDKDTLPDVYYRLILCIGAPLPF